MHGLPSTAPVSQELTTISSHVSSDDQKAASNSQNEKLSADSHTESARKASPNIVVINLGDPEHPNNWPRNHKLVIILGGIASVLNSTYGSSLPSSAMGAIGPYFHITSEVQLVLPVSCYLIGYVVGPSVCGPLSEHFGRRPIMLYAFIMYTLFTMACALANTWAVLLFFRFLCGSFASAPIAIIGGMYADVYSDARKRGVALNLFMAATVCGPIAAPPISGFISEHTSWRWTFGVGALFAAVTLPFIYLMRECYLPVLMSQKAARLRRETGNDNIIAKSDLQKKSFKFVMTVVMTRPYRMLFQELIVSCACAYLSLAYGIFYLSFAAYPIIFQGPNSVYKWSPGVAGLAFLPMIVGALIDSGLFLWWDSYLARAQKRQARWAQIEEYRRLPLACVGGPLFVVSLFWLGWSARADVHWMVPVSSGVLFGVGFLLIFFAILNYLTDSYKTFAASALGMTSTARSVAGALLPLGTTPMFRSLGVAWACSLLAFLSMALSMIPFAFIRYGDKLRANSKFCQQLRAMELQEEKDEEVRLQELASAPRDKV